MVKASHCRWSQRAGKIADTDRQIRENKKVITLYGFGPSLGLLDAGPFVLKVDMYLRMMGLEYKLESGFSAIRNAPKKKLPYVKLDGEYIADSYFILEHLEKLSDKPLDAHLDDKQKAISYLTARALEEGLYWCLVYSRWCIDETWEHFKPQLAQSMPKLIGPAMLPMIRRGVIKQLDTQGFGRHSKDELMEIARQSLSSLSQLLGDQDYFFGDKPSTLDATVYGMVAGMVDVDFSNEFTELARSYSNLCAFTNRLRSRFADGVN